MNKEDILTVKEASKYLKIHNMTMWRLVKDKKIKSFKVGQRYRIRLQDIDRLFEIK